MKKSIIAISCASLLLACTGKQTNNDNAAAQATDSAPTAKVDATQVEPQAIEAPADSQGVAFEAWKMIMAESGVKVKDKCPDDCTVEYTQSEEPDEGFFVESSVTCFPLKSGGWATFLYHLEAAESSPGVFSFNSYTFNDGTLAKADLLPVPSIDELLDAEKCVGQEELVEKFKKVFAQRPKDFLVYYFRPKEKYVTIELRPLDVEAEEEKGDWLETYWDLRHETVYKWNGEKFVK